MARQQKQLNASNVGSVNPDLNIPVPEGYELVEYTLRRVCDGVVRTHRLKDISNTQTPAVPMAASSSYLKQPQSHQSNQTSKSIGSLQSTHLHNISKRKKHRKPTRSNNRARGLSAKTQERNANSRGDGYTTACGIETPEITPPVQKLNHGNGEFRCPRCKSNYTREKSVKDHFPDCIAKYGNPEGLCFTDDPSMEAEDRRIEKAKRTSGQGSSLENVSEDEAMYDAQ